MSFQLEGVVALALAFGVGWHLGKRRARGELAEAARESRVAASSQTQQAVRSLDYATVPEAVR